MPTLGSIPAITPHVDIPVVVFGELSEIVDEAGESSTPSTPQKESVKPLETSS